MRISVLMPSRNRPQMMQEAICSLHEKASGENEITYMVGCDADDLDTAGAAFVLKANGLPVRWRVAPRGPSLGGLVNRLSEQAPADVYCSLCDDVVCLTQGWDERIAEAWRANPAGVWWWVTQNDATFAIVAEKWRAAAGRIFTDYFPFWFDDGWLLQLWLYASGVPGDMLNIKLHDRAPPTHRMRDALEWVDFYWSPAMQAERMSEALRIRKALGWPDVQHDPSLDMKLRDDAREWMTKVQEARGDKSPPTPEYLAALERMRALRAEQQKEAA